MFWQLFTSAKYLAVFLVLVNIRSFPLVWTVRVLGPWFKFRVQEWLQLKRLPSNREARQAASELWWEQRSPVGKKPFEVVERRPARVSIDKTDFNLHLSNSCYPRLLDDARMSWAIRFCPQFLSSSVGGTLPLASTSFLFLKELPLFAPFEIRFSLKTWGDKWLYGVGKFVSRSNRKNTHKIIAAIGTPSDSLTATPFASSTVGGLEGLATRLAEEAEPDGAHVHCVSVSQLCLKIGRVTVPPALVLTLSGLNAKSNPEAYRRLRSMGKDLKPFLTGKWKEESEKWWEVGFDEEVEAIRKERLQVIQGVQGSMETAKMW